MDAAVGTLKFENKAVIPTDPRTKLFLTVTVSTIMITGGTGSFANGADGGSLGTTGGRAIICALADIPAALAGEKGTTIALDAGPVAFHGIS